MLSQLLVNALIAASVYLLVAAGLTLAYAVTRFFHFTHAAAFACGAYAVFVLHEWAHLPLPLSCLLAAPIGGMLGVGLEILVYRPLRRRAATSLVLLLASLGVYVVLQNIVSLTFGDASKSVRLGPVVEGMYFFGGRITSVQLLSILVALALWFLLMAVLAWTRWGRVTRGVMSDQELASVAGIPGDAVILCVSFTASLLAATGGILQALDVDMTPTMGLPALLAGVVAALVGGIGKLPGALLGAALLGIAQQFSVWGIGAQWQDVSAFVVLLVLLVVRPEGFLGRKIRKAAV